MVDKIEERGLRAKRDYQFNCEIISTGVRAYVLLEYGNTHTGDPEIVGVYQDEDALILDFVEHIKSEVNEDCVPLVLASLLGRGAEANQGCEVNGTKYIIWNTEVLCLWKATRKTEDKDESQVPS